MIEGWICCTPYSDLDLWMTAVISLILIWFQNGCCFFVCVYHDLCVCRPFDASNPKVSNKGEGWLVKINAVHTKPTSICHGKQDFSIKALVW